MGEPRGRRSTEPTQVRGRDGSTIALRPTAARLLGALLDDHMREVSARELIERVWASAPPGDPLASLHQTVARLRRALPDDAIRRTRDGYVLMLPDGVLIDDHAPTTTAAAATATAPTAATIATAAASSDIAVTTAEPLRLASTGVRSPFVGRDTLLAAAVADAEAGIGTVFHGIAGTGKSRLVEEVVLELSRRGHQSALLSCRAAGSGTPLGVFVSLLPDTIPRQGVSMVVAAREAITERVGSGRLVLGLDDVHMLDASSAALVSQLVTAGIAVVIATHRNMAFVHAPVALLWHEDFCRHVHVPALDRAATAQLAEIVLGRPPTEELIEELWDLTLGNPLFATTALAHPDFHTAASDETIERLIADQLAGLPPELRDALAVVALAEPIGATAMERLSDTDALVALERGLLIRPERSGRRLDIRMRHPLYGEHMRATTSQLLGRGIRGQLIDVVIDFGARRTDDLNRLADWSLKVGRALPAEVATRTARDALQRDDPAGAERIARLAWEESRSTDTACAAADALYELGDGQAVVDFVAEALPTADAEAAGQLVDVGVRAALFKCGDPSLAKSIAMETGVTEIGITDTGQNADHIADQSIAVDQLPPLDRAIALVRDGRLLDAEAELRSAFDEASLGTRSSTAFIAATLGWVLTWLGRPAEGAELAQRAAHALAGSGHRTLAKWAWLAAGLGGVTARSPAMVDEALGELDTLAMATTLDGWLPLVAAGRCRLAHDHDATRQALLVGAAEAQAVGRWFEEACYVHELARLGATPITRLAPIAAEHGGLVTIFADHASALAGGDDEALAAVAERFAGIGALGIASEAMVQAAEAAAEAGRRDRSRRWCIRWQALAAGCDAPISLAPNIAAEPLTTREQEVALMVSDGHTSREVADRLALSVRTVDNHLAHVFTKLGIASRAELHSALTSGDTDHRPGQPPV